MDKSEKLLFFNKEGYLYNFQYDNIDQKWEGKILFDENSDELFKTQGLYIFESVDPINFTGIFDMEPSQLFNWSGMTFVSDRAKNEIITNIEKVNNSSSFYSKWIYGHDFEIKFRPGTVVSFSGETFTGTGWSDFTNSAQTYFSILSTKKDAVLISTITNNQSFTGFQFQTGATLTSHNIIKVPDYGNEYLVDLNNLNYYEGKKLNIVDSYYNDGIYTYRDYNILKDKVYDFDLSTQTGGTLRLELTLYTERPRLYTGPVEIIITDNSLNGTSIIFENDINNDIQFFNTGQTMIFETYDGGGILPTNPIFTISGYRDKDLLVDHDIYFRTVAGRNYILIDGIDLTGVTNIDQLYLEANPVISGVTFHSGRTFDVICVENDAKLIVNSSGPSGSKIEVEQYVITEGPTRYNIYKKYKRSQIQTLYAQQTTYLSLTGYTGMTNCFTTTNVVSLSQTIINSGGTDNYYENTIDSFNIKYGSYLESLGVEMYLYTYSGTNYLMVDGLYEYNYKPYFAVNVYLNGTPLSIGNNFTFTTGFTHSDVYYFEVDENLTREKISLYDTNRLSKNFTCVIAFDLSNDLLDYGFTINLNTTDYFINYSSSSGTTSCTHETINDFIEKYDDIFSKIGFDLSSGYTSSGYTLDILGRYPNMDIINLDVDVNLFSTYTKHTTHNKGIVISSNVLRSVYLDLYDLELATGMIMSVSNSQYAMNNRDYNIIAVLNDMIQLSYQGPFFYDYAAKLDISTRDFIRKPRSYYDRIVDYKFSWAEQPFGEITKDIFFYDFSGNQLVSYNNITSLTYTGVEPLYSETNDKKVFLNRYANKFESEVTNPTNQQTVFDSIIHRLEMLNDSSSYDYTPSPLEVFFGFNSSDEGVSVNEMKLEKVEYVTITGTTHNSGVTTYDSHFIVSGDTIQYITTDYLFDFNSYGLETDQLISLDFIENNTTTGQTIFNNYKNYRIKDLTQTKIFIDTDYSDRLNYFNTRYNLTYSGKTYDYVINVEPKELLRCTLYGQTEIEDERFDIMLRNLGIDIYKEAEFIFKDSDIQEQSVDYIRLNRKRKEMLSIYPQIFDYVGSYKALIHAIDYFGYNDA